MNMQSSIYSGREKETMMSEKMKVNIASVHVAKSKNALKDASTQYDPEFILAELKLAEEMFDQEQKNLMTTEQKIIMNKIGKYMGDVYFTGSTRNPYNNICKHPEILYKQKQC